MVAMKLKSLILTIALATCSSSLAVLHTGFQGNSPNSQAIAQTAKKQKTDLQVATDEFASALGDVTLNINEATTLFNQRQYQKGLEIYKQRLEQRGQALLEHSGNSQEIKKIAFALFKLATLSEKLGLLSLSDSALSSAAGGLRQATDGLAIFKYTETQQEATFQQNTSSSPTGIVWNYTWKSPQHNTISSTSFNETINLYVPHFNLLQEIYASKGRLVLAQKGSHAVEQEQYYQSLLASEVVRTLSVDQSIAKQLRFDDLDDKLTKFARAFSTRITTEDIKKVANTENATIISYSIISEKDDPARAFQDALRNNFERAGLPVNKEHSQEYLSPDKLFIWVIKPTGEITFVERQIPSNLLRSVPDLMNISGSELCERNATSDDCRGQSSIAISQLVRLARSAIGVRVRGQQGTAFARLVRDGSPSSNAQNSVSTSEQLNQQNEALKQLYKLLIEPIENTLPINEKSHIVFIPQGSLSFVPFVALKDSAGQYLIEKHTIQTAPNFRTLLLANLNRERSPQDNKNVLVVGDPTMPRLQENNSTSSLQLEDLPNAKKEAEAVNTLFQNNHYKANLLTGDRATESRVRDRMQNARIIHLATHGILDTELKTSNISTSSQDDSSFNAAFAGLFGDVKPAGSVVLASSGTSSDEDGLLTSAEIFKLQLKADLVVLSACNTGRGPLTPGGVIGLPFSLSIAGVPSVVVSLWAVPDDSTAQLMIKFYENYLTNPKDKAQAMRQAMLYMINNNYRDSPLDWAAFTLTGTSN